MNPDTETSPRIRLLIVGNPEAHHVGGHFMSAAREMNLVAEIMDSRRMWSSNRLLKSIFHRLPGRPPERLRRFDAEIVAACQSLKPQLLLVTGISPPSGRALEMIGKMGIVRCSFLTDDPWNPGNARYFFWNSLRQYETIYNPRRANIPDLVNHGCQQVEYLPFAYNPEIHFPEHPESPAERERFECDVAIVGGADNDRIPMALALVRSKLKVNLYGGYWHKHPELRPYAKGFIHGRELRLAVGGAKVNICMVRKANRDGHAMRSLEFPAMGAIMLVEDTPEHRDLFGADGDCVKYYTTVQDLAQKAIALCRQQENANLMAGRMLAMIGHKSQHTYSARLRHIVDDQQSRFKQE